MTEYELEELRRAKQFNANIRQSIESFSNKISEKGIAEMYGLVRGPEETEEQLRERLRIFLLERPPC